MPEQEIGVTHPGDAFEQKPTGKSVTGTHVITDGDRDEEAVELSPWAGASSDAPANSGIPSARTQHGLRGRETATDKTETAMADHIEPMKQDTAP